MLVELLNYIGENWETAAGAAATLFATLAGALVIVRKRRKK